MSEWTMVPVLHPPTGQPVAHLPGPWTAEGPDMFGDWNIIPPNECGAVAAVVENGRPPEVVEGNARLVAAAPELLAAAREIVRVHDSYMETIQDQVTAGNMRADPLGQAIETARAAIARAVR